jgi:hypothetical protein
VLSGTQLHRRNGWQCDNSFPQKKLPFCFNHPRDPDVGLRSLKVGSLKDFDVHNIIKKEPASNRQRSHLSDQQDHLPEVLKQAGMMARSCYQ